MARGLLLGLLLLILAEPVLVLKLVSMPRPVLWVLFDGTDSMAIQDELTDSERSQIEEAVGWQDAKPSTARRQRGAAGAHRLRPRAWWPSTDDNLLAKLQEKFQLKAFLLDRADGVRSLDVADDDERLDLTGPGRRAYHRGPGHGAGLGPERSGPPSCHEQPGRAW